MFVTILKFIGICYIVLPFMIIGVAMIIEKLNQRHEKLIRSYKTNETP